MCRSAGARAARIGAVDLVEGVHDLGHERSVVGDRIQADLSKSIYRADIRIPSTAHDKAGVITEVWR
jgi:hypothetical protein